jgi:deoxyribodipyrimidine photo-lyase
MDELQDYESNINLKFNGVNDISNWFPIPSIESFSTPEIIIQNFFEKNLINSGNIKYEFLNGTSNLSPYFKFGLISKREIIGYTLEIKEKFPEMSIYCDVFIEKIVKGEFAHNLCKIYEDFSKVHFNSDYYNFEFENNKEEFEKWKNGETKVPIIDSIMVKLKKSGYINYTSRKFVAAFLVQVMHMDWRLGDDYFKEILIDYDEAISAFNWQIIATGSNFGIGSIAEIVLIEKIYKIIDEDCLFIKKNMPVYEKNSSGEIHLMNYKNVFKGFNMRERQEEYLKKLKKIGIHKKVKKI